MDVMSVIFTLFFSHVWSERRLLAQGNFSDPVALISSGMAILMAKLYYPAIWVLTLHVIL